MDIKVDVIPSISTGPRTVKCNECGWESTWIMPEEVDIMIDYILMHIQQHGVVIPRFQVTLY